MPQAINARPMEVVFRGSFEERTVAVVTWEGVERNLLLGELRAALKEWGETPAGREAFVEACEDFNVGALAGHTDDPELVKLLAAHDIRGLSVGTFSVSTRDGSNWSYDMPLMEVPRAAS